MSTRAERRLKEAQTLHEQATEAHQAAATAFTALEDRAVAGEDVDPLDLAAAQGALGVKAKRLQLAQQAVDTEQATVDEERARARHKELVEAAQATQVDLDTTGIRQAMEDLLRRAYAASDAWSELQSAVRAEHGEIPFYGSGNTASNGVTATNLVKLDGVGYRDRDPRRLARDLRDMADRVFEDLRTERAHARSTGDQPVSWQAKALAAGVQAAQEDEQRFKPTGPDPAA